MPKSAPSTVELDPPEDLLSALSVGGYQARVTVSRKDGQPMTAKDREQAEWLVGQSGKRSLSDAEIARRGQAHLDKQAAARRAKGKAPKASAKSSSTRAKASSKPAAKDRDSKPGKRSSKAAE
jgi:hypothetical protein